MSFSANYTIIRFMPFIETGEFANIGIALYVPEIGFFDFKMETMRTRRVVNFFDEIQTDFYRNSLRNFERELRRIKGGYRNSDTYQTHIDFGEIEPYRQFFAGNTGRRNGLFQFSENKALILDQPTTKLNELFDYYVNRSFTAPERHEPLMVRDLRTTLDRAGIGNRFRKHVFDDGIYQTELPFVAIENEHAAAVIKPIFLGHRRSSQIIDHGMKWIRVVSRFRENGEISGRILFPTMQPNDSDAMVSTERRLDAFKEIETQFLENKIETVDVKNIEKIAKFATAA